MKILLFIIASLINIQVHADSNPNHCLLINQISFGATTTGTKALNDNTLRKGLLIQSRGASTGTFVTVSFKGAEATSEGFTLANNAYLSPPIVPTDAVFIKGSSTVSIPVSVMECQ